MTTNDFSVDISIELNTSLERLYNAWTQPEQLKKWWKPMGKNLSEVNNDLREGGEIKYVFEDESLVIEGEYIEVKNKEKLVYTWNWHLPKDAIKDSNFKLTVEFSEENNIVLIRIVQENLQNEEGAIVHKEGWQKGLNQLKEYLET